MYKIKFLSLVAVAILFSGIVANVGAQSRKAPAPTAVAVPLPIDDTLSGIYSIQVNANELSPGEFDDSTGGTSGFTISGTTEGDLSGFIFISMNYDGPQSTKPGVTSKVSGGSWSKLIFTKGKFVGSIYGRIVNGELVWNGVGVPVDINLQLTADGGTRGIAGNAGTGTFEGILDQSLKRPSVSGQLTLTY